MTKLHTFLCRKYINATLKNDTESLELKVDAVNTLRPSDAYMRQ